MAHDNVPITNAEMLEYLGLESQSFESGDLGAKRFSSLCDDIRRQIKYSHHEDDPEELLSIINNIDDLMNDLEDFAAPLEEYSEISTDWMEAELIDRLTDEERDYILQERLMKKLQGKKI